MHRNAWLGGRHPASRTDIYCVSANTRCRSNWPLNYVVFSVIAMDDMHRNACFLQKKSCNN